MPPLTERHPIRFGLSIAVAFFVGRAAADALEPSLGYWLALILGLIAAVVAAFFVQEVGRRSSKAR